VDSETELSLFVTATYREIAKRFGLSGPNAARTKAKRAQWAEEPVNHPADTKRVRVPREAWEGALSAATASRRERPLPRAPSQEEVTPTLKYLDGALTAALEEHLSRERLRADAAEAREAAVLARLSEADERGDRLRLELDEARRDGEEARVRAASAEGEAKALRVGMDRLEQRLDDAEADRRGEHANWQAARDRLLMLVEALVASGARPHAQAPVSAPPDQPQPEPEPAKAVTPIEATGPSFARWFAALVQRRRAERRQKP
jgi:hypothetical protein